MAAPTGDTSRAALQALSGTLNDVATAMSPGDFSSALAVQMAAAVLSGAANYQPDTLQRATLTPQGALRVSTHDQGSPMTLRGAWGAVNPWAGGSPW